MDILDRHLKNPHSPSEESGNSGELPRTKAGTVAICGSTGFASALSGTDKKLTGQAIFDITTQMRVRNYCFASTGVTALVGNGSGPGQAAECGLFSNYLNLKQRHWTPAPGLKISGTGFAGVTALVGNGSGPGQV